MTFCDVAVARTRLDELTYRYNPEELGDLRIGDCVQVPLRGKMAYGIVFALRETSLVRNPRPVMKVVESGFVNEELLALLRWTGRYYLASLGGVLDIALPRGIYAYRPRPRRSEDVSQQVVCETASDRTSPTPDCVVSAIAGGFGVHVSARSEKRLELVRVFLEQRRRDGGVVLLLPQEKLAGWMPELRAAFGEDLVEYHAGLKPSEQKRAWQTIRRAVRPVVVGVRTAVFAPLVRPAGIAVVDEHSRIYKEERHPRFHARDVAIARAKYAGFPVLLCDRTPSVETYHNLKSGAYHWLERPESAGTRAGSFVVDMRRHRETLFSPRLAREMGRVAEAGLALLYVNRRGISRHVVCRDCGMVLECSRCSLPFVLTAGRTLVCGVCGDRSSAPDLCLGCGGAAFQLRAPGIDLMAREAEKLFPFIKVMTVEAESSEPLPQTGGWVVVGTRALLSRPWPRATRVVAAVHADYDLVVPDFRARERTFQTLYEMERRARKLGARFVLQTWRPEDPAVRYAAEQDPEGFLEVELEARTRVGFPPARRLAAIEVHGGDDLSRRATMRRIERLATGSRRADVLGPIEMRRKGSGAFSRLLVRMDRTMTLDRLMGQKRDFAGGLKVLFDVDPLDVG